MTTEVHPVKRRRPYAAMAAVAALIGAFGMLADEVTEGDTLNFDKFILQWFRVPGNPADPIGPPWVEEAARDVTSLGSFMILGLIVISVAAHFFLRRQAAQAWFLLASVVVGTALSNVLKMVFNRDRPDLTDTVRIFTASFPSGHATLSAVVYLTLGVILSQTTTEWRLKVFYIALAIFITLTVGITRLYLGVHYPTDVLAGWCLGTSWALLCWIGAGLLGLGRPAVR